MRSSRSRRGHSTDLVTCVLLKERGSGPTGVSRHVCACVVSADMELHRHKHIIIVSGELVMHIPRPSDRNNRSFLCWVYSNATIFESPPALRVLFEGTGPWCAK